MSNARLYTVAEMELFPMYNHWPNGVSKPWKKKVRTAVQAANHWTMVRGNNWWCSRGHSILVPSTIGYDRYELWQRRDAKMRRRVLKIFQRHLP